MKEIKKFLEIKIEKVSPKIVFDGTRDVKVKIILKNKTHDSISGELKIWLREPGAMHPGGFIVPSVRPLDLKYKLGPQQLVSKIFTIKIRGFPGIYEIGLKEHGDVLYKFKVIEKRSLLKDIVLWSSGVLVGYLLTLLLSH